MISMVGWDVVKNNSCGNKCLNSITYKWEWVIHLNIVITCYLERFLLEKREARRIEPCKKLSIQEDTDDGMLCYSCYW
jgi:hypothetical protein